MQVEANDADSLNGRGHGGFFGRRTHESERTVGRNDIPVVDNGYPNGTGGRFKNRHF